MPIPTKFLLRPNHDLWLAFDAYLLTRGMLQWYLYKKRGQA